MPAEEFAGKVKRSDTFWKPRFCAHPKAEPYSYLAQRAVSSCSALRPPRRVGRWLN